MRASPSGNTAAPACGRKSAPCFRSSTAKVNTRWPSRTVTNVRSKVFGSVFAATPSFNREPRAEVFSTVSKAPLNTSTLAVPHGHQRSVKGIRVRVCGDSQLQPGTAGRSLFDRLQSAVEHLKAGLPRRREFPGDIDAARFERRIGECLDALDLWQEGIGYHAKRQRVTECRRVFLQTGILLLICWTEDERGGIAIGPGLDSRCAPFVSVPVAKLHPADGAAARLAVFGQMLLGPPAPPVWQPKGRGVKRRRPDRHDEARDSEPNQPNTGTGKRGKDLQARFHES